MQKKTKHRVQKKKKLAGTDTPIQLEGSLM